MTKIWDMLEDHAGGTSTSRVVALVTMFVVLGVWAFVSIRKIELSDIPAGPLTLALGAFAGKVIQRFGEKTSSAATPSPSVPAPAATAPAA